MEGVLVEALPGFDLRARLVDPSGARPVPSVQVTLYARGDAGPRFRLSAVSEADGVVRIPRLPPGAYDVRGESADSRYRLETTFEWRGKPEPPVWKLEPADP